MDAMQPVNILLVDDQQAKLMSYEVVLRDLGENLIRAETASKALQILLKNEIAVVLMDVCMPEIDGFELASMIRDHPRFQRTAIIFISAIHLTEGDYLRGYEMGGVDYVPVPVIPELLRAKVKVFSELYRKTRDLETLNTELERRVRERTAELETSAQRLKESERRRNLALAAGQMGSWDWDLVNGDWMWDDGHYRIFGVDPQNFEVSIENMAALVAPEDMLKLEQMSREFASGNLSSYQAEFRVFRPDGEIRWCFGTAAPTLNAEGRMVRISGVTVDITERKLTEERQLLLAREVDHRARNALAVVQSIVRLTRSNTQEDYKEAVEGRIQALAHAHTLLSQNRWQGADIGRLVYEELAPYGRGEPAERVSFDGPSIVLSPERCQGLALVLHELATNSAKYGALSATTGRLTVRWMLDAGIITLHWLEAGGPPVEPPKSQGFGSKIMNASVRQQIGGEVIWNWRRSGLKCTLLIPASVDADSETIPRDNNLVHLPNSAAKRVLLVEDEPMIGMMMREFLCECGYAVSGPCHTVDEAIAACAAKIDVAILDLNLKSRPSYELAELLQARGIPFAFATGYGNEGIENAFRDIPVLQKPINKELLSACVTKLLETGDMPAAGPSHLAGRQGTA